MYCNWYNCVSCTELIKDADSTKGKYHWDKAKEKKYF